MNINNKKPKHKQNEEHGNYIMNIYAKFTKIFFLIFFFERIFEPE